MCNKPSVQLHLLSSSTGALKIVACCYLLLSFANDTGLAKAFSLLFLALPSNHKPYIPERATLPDF